MTDPPLPAPELPYVLWSKSDPDEHDRTLVVALHGRGATERDFDGLASRLPAGHVVASVRGPIPEGSGYAWFANRGIGRPVPESLQLHTAILLHWLDGVAGAYDRVVLFGFSGGTAMAASLLLTEPARFAGAVLLSGTLPWDTGLDYSPGVLADVPVFYGHSADDLVIPPELIERSRGWLAEVSGARLTAPPYQGFGHNISAPELADIAEFLSQVEAGRAQIGIPGIGTGLQL